MLFMQLFGLYGKIKFSEYYMPDGNYYSLGICMKQINNCTLYRGDCLKLMNKIPDNSIDMVLCDLPYGTTACSWDVIIPFDELWNQYLRITTKSAAIVLFGSEPFSSNLRLSNLKYFKYDWIWHKNTSGGFVSAKLKPLKYHEIISVFYNKNPVYNPQFIDYKDSTKHRYKQGESVNRNKQLKHSTNSIQGGATLKGSPFDYERGKYPESVLTFPSVPNSSNRFHPTQKPIKLLEYLIKTYTNENALVLDNTMGSGSTGVACQNTNRKFIGIEKDKKYFKIAYERMKNNVGTF